MIISEEEATLRLESPLNLLNRLKELSKPVKGDSISPLLPPTADDIVDNLDEKLRSSSIKQKSQSILLKALDELDLRVQEVSKPEQLAKVAESMGKIIESQNTKAAAPKVGTVVIYSPQVMKESDFEVIDISSRE